MTSIQSPAPAGTPVNRRLVAVVVGVVAEVVLLGTLAFAAWGPGGPSREPLSFDNGLGVIAIFALPASLLILGAAASLAAPKRWWGTGGAAVMLCLAGVVGFVGFALTSFSRVEMSDC